MTKKGLDAVPALQVDEIGLTSEKYIPINETITSLPLRITIDRSDMEHSSDGVKKTTATEGGISPARWRLLSHLSESIEAQKQLGFEQSDSKFLLLLLLLGRRGKGLLCQLLCFFFCVYVCSFFCVYV